MKGNPHRKAKYIKKKEHNRQIIIETILRSQKK
jgi:hypothetical protein